MIPLKCIVEYAIMQGQSYDLGTDFGNFQRAIDGTTEKVKERFEQSINAKLAGKRVRARSSKGYKQFERDYEFNVSRTTIDDYYDNFVVVAHDETGRKPKEYFLKPGTKIQIIGPSSEAATQPQRPVSSPRPTRPTTPARPVSGAPVREQQATTPIAYSIDDIIEDITPWIKFIIKDPRVDAREFAKKLGWKKTMADGTSAAVYDIKIPVENSKYKLTEQGIISLLSKVKNTNATFKVVLFKSDKANYTIRIKKISKNSQPTS